MNARQIFEALLEGKKVGSSPSSYMYLNIDGELCVEDIDDYYDTWSNQIGSLMCWEACKIIPEEGP